MTAVSVDGSSTNGDGFFEANRILQIIMTSPAIGRWLTLTKGCSDFITLFNIPASPELLKYVATVLKMEEDSAEFKEILENAACFDSSLPSHEILVLLCLANCTTTELSANCALLAGKFCNPNLRVALAFGSELGAFESTMASFVDSHSVVHSTWPLSHRYDESMYFSRTGFVFFTTLAVDWRPLFPESCQRLAEEDERAFDMDLIVKRGDLIAHWERKMSTIGEEALNKAIAYLQAPLMRRTNAPVMLLDPCAGKWVAIALSAFLRNVDVNTLLLEEEEDEEEEAEEENEGGEGQKSEALWCPTNPKEPFPGTSGVELARGVYALYQNDRVGGEGILDALGMTSSNDELLDELEELSKGDMEVLLSTMGLKRDARYSELHAAFLERYPRIVESVEVLSIIRPNAMTGVECFFSDYNNQDAPNQSLASTSIRMQFRKNLRNMVLGEIKLKKKEMYEAQAAALETSGQANYDELRNLRAPPKRERSLKSKIALARSTLEQALSLPTDMAALKQAGTRAQHKKRDAMKNTVCRTLASHLSHNKKKRIGLRQLLKTTRAHFDAQLQGKSAIDVVELDEFRKKAKSVRAEPARALLAQCSDELKRAIKAKYSKVKLDTKGLKTVPYRPTEDTDDDDDNNDNDDDNNDDGGENFCLLDLLEEYFRLGGPDPDPPAEDQEKKRKKQKCD